MISNNDIEEKVYKKLDSEFGSDVKNLSKCKDLLKTLESEKEDIEKEIVKASQHLTSVEAVSNIDKVSQLIDKMTKEFQNICEVTEEKFTYEDSTLSDLKKKITTIQQLDHSVSYLRCIRSIQDISGHIETHLSSANESEAVAEFSLMCQMSGRLQQSNCNHLKTFLSDTIRYWHNVLKDMFALQLEEVSKTVGWPITGSKIFTTPASETMASFQLIIKHLLEVQLPPELCPPPAVTSSLLGIFPAISLPVMLLLKPVRKRFLYHFSGNKQTNRPDKPEWFMTQALTYIRGHEHFLNQWVQPVYNQTLKNHVSVEMEFTQGLVQLVQNKLHADLPALMFNDTLFSHAIDETLGFDRELRDTIGYPAALPSAVTVLTQANVFVKWIHMERKYARDKMDTMLSSETAWAEVSGSEELKVTEVAESFLTLLSTMTERYSVLPQPGHRLQFVELQSELVDELRVRLLQMLHSERQEPLESHLPAILNTAAHVSAVITEWGTSPHFLLLQHYRTQLETAGKEESKMQLAALQQTTIFDQALTLLQHLTDELVDTLCEAVMMEVKARSRPYRKDKWFAMACETGLTPSACPMFQVLISKLQTLQTLLNCRLFTIAWQSIASQLCSFLLEELVLQNRFNLGGAKQLEQDLNKSLIPVFYQFTSHPEAYFLPLKEACTILNVKPLPEAWSNGQFDNRLSLDLHHLSSEMVANVIQRRADIMPAYL